MTELVIEEVRNIQTEIVRLKEENDRLYAENQTLQESALQEEVRKKEALKNPPPSRAEAIRTLEQQVQDLSSKLEQAEARNQYGGTLPPNRSPIAEILALQTEKMDLLAQVATLETKLKSAEQVISEIQQPHEEIKRKSKRYDVLINWPANFLNQFADSVIAKRMVSTNRN